jgi:hypothetical protein
MAIDLSPLLSTFTSADVLLPVLSVVGVLASIYFALWAAALCLAIIRGDDHMPFSLNDRKTRQFERRYKRERSNREYRQWKKSKGY